MGLISQLSNGTMGMLRLPSPFTCPSVSLGSVTACDIALFLSPTMKAILSIVKPDSFLVRLILYADSRAEALGSPVFPYNPLCL
jgi:hypothetical protein